MASALPLIPRTITINTFGVERETKVPCRERPKARRETSKLQDSPGSSQDRLVAPFDMRIGFMDARRRFAMGETEIREGFCQLRAVISIDIVELSPRTTEVLESCIGFV